MEIKAKSIVLMIKNNKLYNLILFTLLLCGTLSSCRKDDVNTSVSSSVKIIPTLSEAKQVKIVSSVNGKLLGWINSGNIQNPIIRQELFLLGNDGNKLKDVIISDTVYQYVNIVPGSGGGFIVCASALGFDYFSVYEISDDGELISSRNIQTIVGVIDQEPSLAEYNDTYLVVYKPYSWGYYIWKANSSLTELFHKRVPIPNANHYGSGLNYGERFDRLIQANDSMIIIQGVTYDEYDEMIENCFVRSLNANAERGWYSNNYDPSHFETSAGLVYSADYKIVLFGTKSKNSSVEGYGDVFSRTYSLTGEFEKEILYPRIAATPTTVKNIIKAPDGGYLVVGSNNQLPSNIVVSPNDLAMFKLNADLSLSWSGVINTDVPSKGFDAVYLPDGSIGLIGLLKQNLISNKVIYMHLDSFGKLISN